MKKAVVLVSGGLDSSLNLFLAKNEFTELIALTFDYGQRAAKNEIRAAAGLAKLVGCAHRVVDLSFFSQFTQTGLVNVASEIPTSGVDIEDRQTSEQTAKAVWVPNRNGIFLNIAAGFAEGLGASHVIPGFNAEEAATFADNSGEFCKSLDQSFRYSTANKIQVKCYTLEMDKIEMLKRARHAGVPLDLLWPCYFGYDKWCGKCESCKRFTRAMVSNGLAKV